MIDELKVSVIYKGFGHRQINSLLIKDITDILIATNFIMGAILLNGGDYKD